MRRLFVTVLCAASFVVMLPAPAHAWWHWLDELSGPGPFTGWDLKWRVKCFESPPPAQGAPGAPGAPDLVDLSLKNVKRFRTVARILGTGCVFEPDANPTGSLNFAVGQLYSIHNDLQYETGKAHPRVTLTKFEPSYSIFVDPKKIVELTSGAGVMLVTGQFNTLQHFYWKPVLVTITPGAAFGNRVPAGLRGFSLTLGMLIMPKGFSAEDFGAVPGTFRTDREVLGTAEITFDLSRIWR